ncbi:SIR2 family protein [Homoserinibacter sp. GY 40078]|uniref:SIR2 family protein n=1 Tax=Homoserinibacter sp. GY 40078 TaxID=2603275 RepID=UPI0011CA643E|nr:SIR2 family protein [Homoserinibacter sp. GY 40078]TXK18682.1 hypothetical protein FVQ89_01685 [Homoserinibacter sp. GY 40078]
MVAFQTVVSGAGISRSWPSELPDGDQLAALAWRLVADRAEALYPRLGAVIGEAERRIASSADGLRLEQLMAVMARDVPLDVLAGVYGVMDDALPNTDHRTLVSAGRVDHFTLNMDSLLERAAEGAGSIISLVHLHGIHFDPSSIITTIEQYLDGLPEPLSSALAEALTGREVLVVGYSGRDRDVLPMFLRYPPARLTWLVHRRDGEPEMDRDHDEDLEPEAAEMLARLRERIGPGRVTTPRATLSEMLEPPRAASTHRGEEERRGGRALTAWSLPGSALERISSVDPSCILMAVGAVMLEVGMYSEALGPLRRARPRPADARIRRRKQIGRALAKTGQPRRALWSFMAPIPRVSPVRQVMSMLTEVANVATAAGLPARAISLDRMIVDSAEPLRRAALLARSRRGQRMNLQGHFGAALAEFDQIIDAEDADRLAGLSQIVDALTWAADVEKVRGNYAAALDRIRRAELEVPYSNRSQRAWVAWKRAEIRMLSGLDPRQAEEELVDAAALAKSSGDRAAEYWATVTLAGVRGADPETGLRTLRQAEALQPSPRADARVYLLLQRAEIARASGALEDAARDLLRARGIISNRSRLPTGYASASRVIDLIEAKIAFARADPGAVASLANAAAAFDALEMHGAASHTRICHAEAAGVSISDAELGSWAERGWRLEAELARHPSPTAALWQLIL